LWLSNTNIITIAATDVAAAAFSCCAVYHVTEDGWKKVRGDDVTECHFEYYPDPAAHASAGTPVI
jgi:20S proteasome subunit beta 5